MKSGEVVWVEFPGIVQTKQRPAVIVSSATYHQTRPDVIFGLITSQTSKSNAPTDYLLEDWQSAGLRVPSAFRTFLVTLPKSSIVKTMGVLSDVDWKEIQLRLQIAIDVS